MDDTDRSVAAKTHNRTCNGHRVGAIGAGVIGDRPNLLVPLDAKFSTNVPSPESNFPGTIQFHLSSLQHEPSSAPDVLCQQRLEPWVLADRVPPWVEPQRVDAEERRPIQQSLNLV